MILIITFIIIGLISFYGDYEEKEKKRDYEKYEEIVNGNRDTTKTTKPK